MDLIKFFEILSNDDSECKGIERFLSKNGNKIVFEHLKNDKNLGINKVKFNQLLLLSGIENITFGCFQYYWLSLQKDSHPYDLTKLIFEIVNDKKNKETYNIFEEDNIQRYFKDSAIENNTVNEIQHLRWGLLRIFTDALLYFGNIHCGFVALGKMKKEDLISFFEDKKFDTAKIKKRGKCFEFEEIDKEERYLISEAVCKNLDGDDASKTELKVKLINRFEEAKNKNRLPAKIGLLLDENKTISTKNSSDIKTEDCKFTLEDEISIEGIINKEISKIDDINKVIDPLYERFQEARKKALVNTKLYLSIINDLDVYVATSMRKKDDFLEMAKTCYKIFHNDQNIKEMNLRYFDPTISAAEGHDDKGIVECLMVKCAKVLIYISGSADSYGKDAEAAMALSSGKPVIFYCTDKVRKEVSKDIHPLSKLIDFETGVANGAIIAEDTGTIMSSLKDIFNNKVKYIFVKQHIHIKDDSNQDITKSYFKLQDQKTHSTIRAQTSDLFLTEIFWNYYSRYIKK